MQIALSSMSKTKMESAIFDAERENKMKLCETKDWKAIHFTDRTILKSDKYLYPAATWNTLTCCIDVQKMNIPGHYKPTSK